MVAIKSLDYIEVIIALLCDVQNAHSDVFTTRSLRLTIKKVRSRCANEGLGFLTKTLPRLGKCLDKALACHAPLDSTKCGFSPLPGSKLPRFLGELFKKVLDADGNVLQVTDATCVKSLRQVLYLFYKLELPYDSELEQQVIQKFQRTEEDLLPYNKWFLQIEENLCNSTRNGRDIHPDWLRNTIRGAQRRLWRLFKGFDVMDIYPRHGPGSVSTKETGPGKYTWTQIPKRLTDQYPLDAYFHASIGHVCDEYRSLEIDDQSEPYARVCLVPKDSRGPRLISCEPLAFQWIQQGLGSAIVRHVERHHLTRDNVRFTDQLPNRMAALAGSWRGQYATLDLNEASDRVSIGLVHLLFPEPVRTALMSSRSLGTTLPSGEKLKLNKFAPMGSALCFPVLALTVWAILTSGLETFGATADELSTVYVYGDDVIVPAKYAEHAMNILESFGLKINRDKSCTKGLFRESCGLDAYKAVDVTPVRIRTVWSSHRCPDSYVSWIAYANSMHERKYYTVRDYITDQLISLYKEIPEKACGLSAPSLYEVPEHGRPRNHRVNKALQRVEWHVWDTYAVTDTVELSGWKMLLRYFSEACSSYETARSHLSSEERSVDKADLFTAFSVREYTKRRRNKMRKRWR